jgi:hypothetical protein
MTDSACLLIYKTGRATAVSPVFQSIENVDVQSIHDDEVAGVQHVLGLHENLGLIPVPEKPKTTTPDDELQTSGTEHAIKNKCNSINEFS